ncbi:MAG: hypothetical protein A2054_00315 [Deltaproteobacteria bacterium GWA2_55_10]|nr:MAG: hypothetical protein A2054_00315 [Deltaproteobacteria bacterium GWA2_55_10]
MLKKSIHGFFNNGLSEVNSAKPHKLLDFQVSQFGNPSLDCLAGCFFNNLLSKNFSLQTRQFLLIIYS